MHCIHRPATAGPVRSCRTTLTHKPERQKRSKAVISLVPLHCLDMDCHELRCIVYRRVMHVLLHIRVV